MSELSMHPAAIASREYRRLHPEKCKEYHKHRKPLTESQREVMRKRSRDNWLWLSTHPNEHAAYNKARRDRYMFKRYGIKRTNGTDND